MTPCLLYHLEPSDDRRPGCTLNDRGFFGKVRHGHVPAVGACAWRQKLAHEQVIDHHPREPSDADRQTCGDVIVAIHYVVDRLGRAVERVGDRCPGPEPAAQETERCADVVLLLLIEVAHG